MKRHLSFNVFHKTFEKVKAFEILDYSGTDTQTPISPSRLSTVSYFIIPLVTRQRKCAQRAFEHVVYLKIPCDVRNKIFIFFLISRNYSSLFIGLI